MSADLVAEVGERLMSMRVADGLDIDAVAEEIGMDVERLESAEAGTLALDERELRALAEVYGVEVTAFFGGRTTPLSYLFGA